MRARCTIHDYDAKRNIVFLEDLANQTGGRSITNDAGAVMDYYRAIYGNSVRIVYLDTDSEWWEIVWQVRKSGGNYVAFRPWHGLVWDELSKV